MPPADQPPVVRSAVEIQAWLIRQIADLTGAPPETIDPREAFDAFGLSSREAVMLSGDLEEWLGRDLSPTLVYEYPTIAKLAEFLAESPRPSASASLSPSLRPAVTGRGDEIAVIGLACRFPGADGPDAFWRLLRDGVDAITEVPPDRWDVDELYDPAAGTPGKMVTRWGGFLKRVDEFDARFFGISPREAIRMDPQQRLLLETAWEALEHAGLAPEALAGSPTGVFVGLSSNDYAMLQGGDLEAVDAYAGTGNAASVAANRLSYVLDLRGPSLAIDTACSSSLVAVHLACASLRRGEADLALAGGVNLVLAPELNIAFSHAHMMAADGRCKTFDAGADGYVRGEGVGLVVLKRLADALADGDPVLAVIRGSAVNQDGRTNGLTAPSGLAQQAVIRAALADARLQPNQIDYVEAHGTGTNLGDPIETRALAVVMAGRKTPALLGSVKTNIGHLEAAAGVAGLIKVILALQHQAIPPHLHLKTLNPLLDLGSVLEVAAEGRPWPAHAGPRYAGVSSFGFGGTNAHVIVEEAPRRAPLATAPERPRHLLALSARDEAALRELAGRYAEADLTELADLAFTAHTGRARFEQRLAVTGESSEQVRAALAAFASGRSAPGLRAGRVTNRAPRVAFLFTGQGAQYSGMARQLYETQPTFRAALDRCVELLTPHLDAPLLDVIFDDERRFRPSAFNLQPLNQTAYTQPALFAVEYALAQLWMSWGVKPEAVLGHSVGEYVAACLAGVFSLEDGLRLIAARGRLIGALPPGGAMAAVFAEPARVEAALAGEPEVALAALNGPASVVISGRSERVQAVTARLQAEGVEVRALAVSHAFHSPLMDSILDEFEQVARSVPGQTPQIPLISNLTGQVMTSAPDAAYWRRHLRAPVQFMAGLQAVAALGCDTFVEAGPHPALTALGKRILADNLAALWLPSLRRDQADWDVLLDSLAAFFVRGGPVDWAGFDRDYARRKVHAPTYPFQRERFWFEPAARTSRPASRRDERPLIGRRLASPLSQVQYEVALDQAAVEPYGPTEALWRAMARAAAEDALGLMDCDLGAVVEHAPLSLEPGEARTVQIILDPSWPGGASFQIFSLANGQWQRHASGVALQPLNGADSDRASRPPAILSAPELTRDALLAAPVEERPTLLAAALRALTARVLRLAPAQVDLETSIRYLGLDSIMALELKAAVERGLGVPLPVASLLTGPSVSQLAGDLLARLATPAAPDDIPAPMSEPAGPGAYPLSHGQRALWFQHQVSPDSVYNPTHAVQVRAALDLDTLRAAFEAVAQRHTALHTTFHLRDGAPVQVVGEQATLAFEVVDAAGWTEAALRERLNAAARRPFDLEHGPLLRVTVFSRAADDHVILLAAHHLVVDLWSNAILINDAGRFYADPALRATRLPPAFQYTDYLRWHADLLAGPAGQRLWAYWRDKLSGPLPLLDLPTDRPRPAVQTFRGAMETVILSPELTRRLKTLSERLGATLYTTLLAAFQVLLHRYTGQTDLVVGTPTNGRSRAEFTDIVGYFVNPVALRSDLSGNPTFAALLAQVRQTVMDAIAHQDFPFTLLVEKLQPERHSSRTPLFQVMFVFQRAQLLADEGLSSFALGAPGAALTLAGLPLEAIALDEHVAPFELTLLMAEVGDGLGASFTYNADLFTTATIERLAGHFTTLLEGLASDPDQPIQALPLLTTAEHRQLLVDWNATDAPFDFAQGRPFDLEQPAPQLIEAQAARAPEAVAVSLGDETLTYGELDQRANRLARVLQERGVGPDVIVAVCVEPSLEMVVAVLGVLKAGGAYLPLDPRYPPDRLAFMLTDSGAPILLTQEKLKSQLPRIKAHAICLDADWELITPSPHDDPPSAIPYPPAAPSSLAYVIYTSGSTGQPKGVMIEHRGLTNLTHILLDRFALTPASRVLQFASFSFDASVSEIVATLAAGARLVLAPRETLRAPDDLLALLRREAITCVTLPPSLLSVLRSDDLPALETVISAGEACTWEIAERWRAGRRLLNGYGPTETTVAASYYLVGERLPGAQTVPIGRPNPNVRFYVLDAQRQPVPIGVPGELYIGGVGVARGYLNRPELTAEKFIPSPLPLSGGGAGEGDRLYRTGDLVRWLPSGDLEFLGRLDDQVKVRGFRIELGEIEAALRAQAEVRDAAVVVRAADGDQRLLGYIVPADAGAAADGRRSELIATIRARLRERLPEHLLPATLTVLDALPLTPNGKVDRRALARLRPARAEAGAEFVQPQSDLERSIAEVWQGVLGLERVGLNDNFFDLGGHSLLMVKVQAELQQRLGRELPIVDLFQFPTVSALAGHLSRAGGSAHAVQAGQTRAEKQKAALAQQQQRLRAAAAARRPGVPSNGEGA